MTTTGCRIGIDLRPPHSQIPAARVTVRSREAAVLLGNCDSFTARGRPCRSRLAPTLAPGNGPPAGLVVVRELTGVLWHGRTSEPEPDVSTSYSCMSMHELEYSLTLSRSRRRSSCGLFHCSGRKSDRRFCDCQAVVEFGGEAHAERPFWREATPAWRVDGPCGPGAAQGLSRRFYRPLPYVVRAADMCPAAELRPVFARTLRASRGIGEGQDQITATPVSCRGSRSASFPPSWPISPGLARELSCAVEEPSNRPVGAEGLEL